ncbi:MAG: addiction module toxin RelE, partial [Muribaculaceae bacterium]|nr:addiction module toxin RelE [Muribaculaceae bacterium]
RMAITSKGRGKSGGARVITYTVVVSEKSGRVYLMDIYDKSDYSTVDVRIIQKKIEALGLL